MKRVVIVYVLTLGLTLMGLSGPSAQVDDIGVSPSLADRFHIANRPYSKLPDSWSRSKRRAYDKAIANFSDFSACRETGSSDASPSLNWNVIRSKEQVDICFFLLAEYLETPAALILWLKASGFSTALHDQIGIWPSENAGTIHASYKLGVEGDLYFQGLVFKLAHQAERSVSIAVRYDSKSVVISSNATINWE